MNQTIKIKRTIDPDKPPATLEDGELALGMNDVPPRMWAGCDGVVKELFAGTAIEDAEDDAVYGRSDGEWVPVPIVSATVPTDPAPSSFWFNTTDGSLYFLFDDGDSVQWIHVAGKMGVQGPPGIQGPVGVGGTLSQHVQVFTTSGIYNPSPGLVSATLECVGGGAGGAGVVGEANWVYRGSGGGSGGYSRKIAAAAEIGASQPVFIGIGGAGGIGNVANGAGSAGGNTSIGTLCVALGAPAPTGWTESAAGAPPGVGDFTAAGMPSEGGGYILATSGMLTFGAGGSGFFGGGAAAPPHPAAGGFFAGNPGRNYGAGGSGAVTHNSLAASGGAAGSAGVAVITELCVN